MNFVGHALSVSTSSPCIYMQARYRGSACGCNGFLVVFVLLIGEDLYRVGKHIGSGAFGKVFSAKRLSVDLGNDEEEDSESMPLAIKVGLV